MRNLLAQNIFVETRDERDPHKENVIRKRHLLSFCKTHSKTYAIELFLSKATVSSLQLH